MSSFSMRVLGKTGLQVSPLGLGGGNGLHAEDLLYAFDHGINYFFYSSDLHHFAYSRSAPALRKLCAQGSSVRDQVVLATVSYIADPDKLLGALVDQFSELGVEYIDIFHWGWITAKCDALALALSLEHLKENERVARAYKALEAACLQAEDVNQELRKRGLVRHVGMSFHSRRAALKAMPLLDVMMLRYNIARTEIEETIFPRLASDKENAPGIVVFNVAHEGLRFFHTPPPRYPQDLYVPTIPDCYRFALSNPWVDVVLAGATARNEIDQALHAMEQGPLDQEDYAFLREYGSLFTGDFQRKRHSKE